MFARGYHLLLYASLAALVGNTATDLALNTYNGVCAVADNIPATGS